MSNDGEPMTELVDYAAFDLGPARLRLRPDLRFKLHEQMASTDSSNDVRVCKDIWYVIEDELNGKFYRVGYAEYIFLSLLDGETTIQSAIAETAARLKGEAFSQAEAGSLCKWLIENDLADKSRFDGDEVVRRQAEDRNRRRATWQNPIMLKVPIGNPDRFATWVNERVGWLVSWPIGFVIAVLVVLSVANIIVHWQDLTVDRTVIFSSANGVSIATAWIVLRLLHELGHTLTCKRFGGSVREWGVLLLLFVPLPYVDVTSSWRFPSRWNRMLTAAAGMIVELAVAAVAGLVWIFSDDLFVRQTARNVMLAASVTTVLFNANPLMRFDGYHLLTDFLNAPNLWTHGRQYVRNLGRRWFFGLAATPLPCPARLRRFTKIYGVASLLWTVVVLLSLTLAAFSLMDGIGLLLALICLGMWVLAPLARLGRFLVFGSQYEQPDRKRFATLCGALFFCAFLLGAIVPAPTALRVPVVVKHDPLIVLRSESPGFVRKCNFQLGDQVKKGDLVCRLENIDLQAEFERVEAQLRASRQRARAYQSAKQPAAYQAEFESVRELEQRHHELTDLVKGLEIRSTVDGVVLENPLKERLGSYVHRGDPLVTIGGTTDRIAVGLVSQNDTEYLTRKSGCSAMIYLDGTSNGPFSAELAAVKPRVTFSLPHPGFAAAYGGSLDVIPTDPSMDERRSDAALRESNWHLADPHVEIEMKLSHTDLASQGCDLRTGQMGTAIIRSRDVSIGKFVRELAIRYLQQKARTNHGL